MVISVSIATSVFRLFDSVKHDPIYIYAKFEPRFAGVWCRISLGRLTIFGETYDLPTVRKGAPELGFGIWQHIKCFAEIGQTLFSVNAANLLLEPL